MCVCIYTCLCVCVCECVRESVCTCVSVFVSGVSTQGQVPCTKLHIYSLDSGYVKPRPVLEA